MKITDKKNLPEYHDQIGHKIRSLIDSFDFSDKHVDLGYSTQASAVYSSNIEGNSIDLNTFMNYKLGQEKFKPTKEIEEIENLIRKMVSDWKTRRSILENPFRKILQGLSGRILCKYQPWCELL